MNETTYKNVRWSILEHLKTILIEKLKDCPWYEVEGIKKSIDEIEQLKNELV